MLQVISSKLEWIKRIPIMMHLAYRCYNMAIYNKKIFFSFIRHLIFTLIYVKLYYITLYKLL